MEDHKELSENELEIIKGALRAACEGPFFEDWEFQTLIGVGRDVVCSAVNDWPAPEIEDDAFECAIKGSMIMLVIYPHGRRDELIKYIPGGIDAIKRLIEKLYLP